MNIYVIIKRSWSHCHDLRREFDNQDLNYQLLFTEDHPELVDQYRIRNFPCVIVTDQVLFQQQPNKDEIHAQVNVQ